MLLLIVNNTKYFCVQELCLLRRFIERVIMTGDVKTVTKNGLLKTLGLKRDCMSIVEKIYKKLIELEAIKPAKNGR